jgi:2-dehydropantoate 2-reductase
MRIAMMGSGGIGGLVGARLAEAGEDVAFIARGAHLDAMRRDGLKVTSPFGNVHLAKVTAAEEPGEIGPVDLVIFAVKMWDTETAAARLPPLIAPHTRVVTLQNGIDSVDALRRHVPGDQVVGGVTYLAAAIAEPGVISSPGGSRLTVVHRSGGAPIVAALAAAGEKTIGIDIKLTDDIDAIIWEKFLRFAAFSAATTLMRSRAGPVRSNPESRAFLRALVEDGVRVAEAAGHSIAPDFADKAMAFIDAFPPTQRSSMADDIEHGRRLEVPFVSGRIHALGEKYGVPTPAHTAAWRALALYANGTPAG